VFHRLKVGGAPVEARQVTRIRVRAALAAIAGVIAVAGCYPATPAPPSTGIRAWQTAGCGALPAPTGPVIDVTPAQAGQLGTIVRNAAAGTTIRFADGTYPVTGDFTKSLLADSPGLTLRGASGDPTKVVIDGQYAIGALVYVQADDVTLTDLTLRRATDHLVHSYPAAGTTDVERPRLHRLRLVDAGEQFVKVNPNGARTAYVDTGTISCSEHTMTATGRANIERSFGCYTGGIDVHGGRDWVVRSNTFEGIYCEDGEIAEHAIHFWNGARGTLVENNLIRNTSRGIGFGLLESGVTRSYPDNPYPGLYVGHFGGTIRGNVIANSIDQYDTGIELAQSRGTTVVHNTVIETGAGATSYSSIDRRFANTTVELRNNLVRRLTTRNGAGGIESDNVENVPAAWFVDAAAGDAHLTATAANAIDDGFVLPVEVAGTDLDGLRFDAGPPDIGADERR
jgi:hypothetical protein